MSYTPRLLSYQAVAVLHAVASGVPYGFQIIDETGLTSGTVYTSLGRLERDGYLRSRWEDARTAHEDKRPPRRYYTITADGARVLDDSLARFRALRPLRASAVPVRG
jgi:PadR family transcriptional regulator, regulatory protein PadR